MARPNHRLVEDAFAPLRAEADRLTQALAGLRQAAASGASAGGRAAGASGAERFGFHPFDVEEARNKSLLKSFKDLQQAIQHAGPLAKKLGFEEAAKQIERVALGMDAAATAAKGIAAAANLVAIAWRPVAIAVGAATAAVVVLQRVLEHATGQTHSLGNTVRLFGLGVAEGVEKAKAAFFALKGIAEGNPFAYTREIADARIEALALKATIQEIQAEGKDATPFRGWGPELERLKNDVKTLGAEIGDSIGGTLGLSTNGERKSVIPSTTEFREAGNKGGVALAEGMRQGIQSVDVSASIFDAVTGKTDKSPLGIFGAVGGFLGMFAGASRGTYGRGWAAGGAVTPGGRPSLAHMFARGFAGGGPPPGVPASDTVAAWLTPGEWVQPVNAVRAYGSSVMEAIRSVRIDPGVLQSLAAGVRVPAAARTPAPRGYAAGGAVAGGGSGGAGMVLPVLPVNESLMEELLRNGGNPLTRWLSERGVM